MTPGAIRVDPDGGLTIDPQQADDLDDLEAVLSVFADRDRQGEDSYHYRLRDTALWRARRAGLSFEQIIQTLEDYGGGELPAPVRADLELWNRQIERLSVEVDNGELVLRSANPLVITAVLRHRTLSEFVIEQLDATTASVQAEAYPALIETFDASRYPVMDRVPPEWTPGGVAPAPVATPPPSRPPRPSPQRQRRVRRSRRPPGPPPGSSRCQALTKAGRPCKNRVRSGAAYCRVHADANSLNMPFDPEAGSILARLSYQIALEEEEELSFAQLARSRVTLLMWIGLSAWLGYHLVMGIVAWWPGWALWPWWVAGLSVVGSCMGLGRVVTGLNALKSLEFVGLNVLSLGLDCLHKEGLIVNFCYVGIPVILPLWLLSQLGLSWAWLFLCFPVGLWLGQLVYTILDDTSV